QALRPVRLVLAGPRGPLGAPRPGARQSRGPATRPGPVSVLFTAPPPAAENGPQQSAYDAPAPHRFSAPRRCLRFTAPFRPAVLSSASLDAARQRGRREHEGNELQRHDEPNEVFGQEQV